MTIFYLQNIQFYFFYSSIYIDILYTFLYGNSNSFIIFGIHYYLLQLLISNLILV